MSELNSKVSRLLGIRSICESTALPICAVISEAIKNAPLIEPSCYSRNIEVFGIMIFEPATLLVYLVAFVMTGIMMYHVKVKYMAVGRKEILMFFTTYFITLIVNTFLYTGIIPIGSPVYKYFVALDMALMAATYTSFFANGFTPFQFIEDGTPLSLWSIRISSLAAFCITYAVTIATFNNFLSFSIKDPIWPFIIIFVLGGIAVLLYCFMQIALVFTRIGDKWPLGDILLGLGFYSIGIFSLFWLSDTMCNAAGHYIDGIFVVTICNLLSVMMVYKYWDSITKEDLEFSVSGRDNIWEMRDPLLDESSASATPGLNSVFPYS